MQRVYRLAVLLVWALPQVGCDGRSVADPDPRPNLTDDAFRALALARVNAFRDEPRQCGDQTFAAAEPVTWSSRLEAVAHRHSADMATHNFFSHTGSDGLSPGERLTAAGYRWRFAAENLAAGQSTLDTAIDAWIDSPGHCANLMHPGVREIGVAWVYEAGSDYGIYWTMKLAAPN